MFSTIACWLIKREENNSKWFLNALKAFQLPLHTVKKNSGLLEGKPAELFDTPVLFTNFKEFSTFHLLKNRADIRKAGALKSWVRC